jgi:hypothetical protein
VVAVVMVIMVMAMIMTVMVVVVVVVVIMVMVMVMMMMMIVTMMVVSCRNGVGAAFGLERCFDRHQLCAQRFEQRFDGRVPLDPKPPLQHFHRHVPVPEMPGQPGERGKVGGARLDQRLGLGHHLDRVAVVKQQRIISAQPDRLGEVKLDAGAFDAEHKPLVRLTLRVRQDQRVDDGGALPFSGG